MDKKYEETLINFGNGLESLCRKHNPSNEQLLYDLDGYVETMISYIIEDYPDISDTRVCSPENCEHFNCQIPIEVIFVDGIKVILLLNVQVNICFEYPNKVYNEGGIAVDPQGQQYG